MAGVSAHRQVTRRSLVVNCGERRGRRGYGWSVRCGNFMVTMKYTLTDGDFWAIKDKQYPPRLCASAYPQIGGSFHAEPIMMSPFVKPALRYDEQVALLQSRGMVIDNGAEAVTTLNRLNYYRLRAYWVPLEVGKDTHQFREGTTFDQVVHLYTFDRELRLLVLGAIERVEVSVRAIWAYNLAHEYGPFGYLQPEHFEPRKTMARCRLRS